MTGSMRTPRTENKKERDAWRRLIDKTFNLQELTPDRILEFTTSGRLGSVLDLTKYITGLAGDIIVSDLLNGKVLLFLDPNLFINSVLGTINQVIVTDNFDTTITLSTPQDIHIEASPTFKSLLLQQILNQATIPVEIKDLLGNSVLSVFSNGHIDNLDGISTEATKYGTGLYVNNFGERAPLHTNGIGSYDHTGGAEEKLFTKTSGDDFTQADADVGNHILLRGADIGAMAEIKTYISATQVLVDGYKWNSDFSSQSFHIINHPVLVVGDGNKTEISAGSDGEFEVFGYNFISGSVMEVGLDAAANNVSALNIDFKGNGYDNIAGLLTNHNPGDIQPGAAVAANVVLTDDSEAVNADSSSVIAGIGLITTTASDATRKGIVLLPGWTTAVEVQQGEPINPNYGYQVTSGVVIDRVNSGGGGNDAFINPAVDVQLFISNGDYFLIGHDDKFSLFQAILSIFSSKDILETIEYSTGAGTWSTLTLIADGMNGWQQSGIYSFDDPGAGWIKVSEAEAPADITLAYYMKVARTVGGAVPTLPTESFFKICESVTTTMRIRGDGSIEHPYIADVDAENNSTYYSTDQSKLVYKDPGGTVNDLY